MQIMDLDIILCSDREVFNVKVEGPCGLQDAKQIVRKIVLQPQYSRFLELVFDIRRADCSLSVPDIYNLSKFVAWPEQALPSCRRVAIVVSKGSSFNRAKLFAAYTRSRGLFMESFPSLDAAREWLQAEDIPTP